MRNSSNIPFFGIAIAVVTFVALLLAGAEPVVSTAALVLWIGSLLLISSRPPERPARPVARPFTSGNMKALIENASTPLLVTEGNRISSANRAARKVLGKHIIGQDTRVTFRQPSAIQMLSENSNGQAIVQGLARRRDIWELNRQAIDDELAVIELINRTAEADISRAHTDFVANASHELRTPLAAIIGYSETLTDGNDSLASSMAQKFLDTIQKEARRMQSLVSDLMSLSRIEAEKHDQPEELIELGGIVESAARDAAGPDRFGRVQIQQDPGIQIRGDLQQIEQLVRNLVDNALKYGAPGSDVILTLTKTENGNARIEVIDEGEGIAPEHIPHLTRRFYRTDPSRSRASGGTGLGLAIVKHIVERHRGRLDISSEVGKGTSVAVRIPLAQEDKSEKS